MTTDWKRRAEIVEAENFAYRERIRQLEALLAPTEWTPPVEWGLTRSEERVLIFLVKRRECSKEQLYTFLYGGMEAPEQKIIDVFICKLRRKLKLRNYRIITLWGRGYKLADDSYAALRRLSGLTANDKQREEKAWKGSPGSPSPALS